MARPFFFIMPDNVGFGLNWNIPNYSGNNIWDMSQAEVSAAQAAGFMNMYESYNDDLMPWLTGSDSEYRNYAMQDFFQQRQWMWDKASSQMARFKEAGINLNLAAQGVAGGNVSAGVPSVNPPVTTPAASMSQIADAAGTVSRIPANIAELGNVRADTKQKESQALLNAANERQVDPLAESLIFERAGKLVESIGKSGPDEIEWLGLALEIYKNPIAGSISAFKSFSEFRKYNRELEKLNQEISQTQERFDHEKEMWPHDLAMNEKDELFADWHNRREAALALIEERKKLLRERFKTDPDWSISSQLFDLFEEYGQDSDIVKNFYDALKQGNYYTKFGSNLADVNTIFEETWNKILAEETVSIGFAPIKTKLQAILEGYKAYYKAMGDKADDPISWIFQKIMVPMIKSSLNGEVFDWNSLGIPDNASPKTSNDVIERAKGR